MERVYFEMEFLENVVLNKSNNTEGFSNTLDFVSGSVFLGIVAREYERFSESFEIFHTPKVRFSQAVPYVEGKRAFKVPFSFYHSKGDASKVFNAHLNPEKMQYGQVKQKREGYFVLQDELLCFFELGNEYHQKSAYDSQKRKSEDSKMFGYYSLERDSQWVFYVEIDGSIREKDKIIEALEGIKYLGRSKNAQYGKVKIKRIESTKGENVFRISQEDSKNGVVYLYADSEIALFENGESTLIPSIENLGLSSGKIKWEECQIRTRSFKPFNSKRRRWDHSRNVITQGSVIALENVSKSDLESLKNGIGGYLNEGYGKVLVNPIFLLRDIKSKTFEVKREQAAREVKTELIEFLLKARKQKEQEDEIGNQVSDFIESNKEKLKSISNSQWGNIRMILEFSKEEWQEKIKEYIYRDYKSKDKRIKKQYEDCERDLIGKLEKENLEFWKLLAIQAPKAF